MNAAVMLEAHPTHYKGQLFRSKSEAIFIRSLELAGWDYWEYEPARFKVDGWTPDFWAIRNFYNRTQKKRVISSLLIEYKPAPVTDSYKAILAGRFDCILKQSIEMTVLPVLAIGNAFDRKVKREAWFTDGKRWDLVDSFFFAHLDEARNYRYDLERGGE
jgi:hypothetical protein